jgi:uncharacterized RDD family membrane protein YckC
MVQGRYADGSFARPGGAQGYGTPSSEGVLGRRFFAYMIDIVVIFMLTLVFGFVIGIFGLVTFGLGWWLYAVLVPGTAILYSGFTVGGRSQGTIGMRMTGVVGIDAATGGPVPFLTAAVHALLFYIAAGTFLLLVLDVVIGMGREDRRMGHDLLAGIVFLRRF